MPLHAPHLIVAATASYQAVSGLHVVAALAWIGIVLHTAIGGGRIRVRRELDDAVAAFGRIGWLSRWVALPGAVVTLLAGGWLLHDGGYSLTNDWWVGTGLGAWIIAFLGSTVGRGFECRTITRLHTQQVAQPPATGGSDAVSVDEDVAWRLQRVVFLARGEAVLLVVAFAVMLIKPN